MTSRNPEIPDNTRNPESVEKAFGFENFAGSHEQEQKGYEAIKSHLKPLKSGEKYGEEDVNSAFEESTNEQIKKLWNSQNKQHIVDIQKELMEDLKWVQDVGEKLKKISEFQEAMNNATWSVHGAQKKSEQWFQEWIEKQNTEVTQKKIDRFVEFWKQLRNALDTQEAESMKEFTRAQETAKTLMLDPSKQPASSDQRASAQVEWEMIENWP